MNEIKIFQNEQFGQVRIAMNESNEPMFCLADVAKALGYINPAKAVIDHCKGVTILETPTQGGIQQMKFGKESEVYRLTMRSKLPDAERFQDWVCEDVLPSIRRHGTYMTTDILQQMIQNPDNLIQLLTVLKDEQEQNAMLRMQSEADALTIETIKPKAEYFDTVLKSTSLIATDAIAAELGISAIKLNKFLCDMRIQRRVNGVYVLLGDIRGKGFEGYKTFPYTDARTGEIKTKKHMYWTEKGFHFIQDLFRRITTNLLN